MIALLLTATLAGSEATCDTSPNHSFEALARDLNIAAHKVEAPEESYRTLVPAGKVGGLTSKCKRALKQVFDEGRDLSSDTIMDAVYPLDSVKLRTGNQNDTFFHYFNATARGTFRGHLMNQGEGMVEILKYQKRRGSAWDHPFYIAEDPHSSARFGNRAAMLRIDPKAKTITHSYRLFKKGLDEVFARIPSLYACDRWRTINLGAMGVSHISYHQILYLILEESGVEVVNYSNGAWFQLLSSSPVREIKVDRERKIQEDYPR